MGPSRSPDLSGAVRPDRATDPVGAVLAAHAEGRDLALTTSGTTGAPRTIVRSTASWWDSFPAYSALTGVASGARVWVPGPLAATMNLFAAVHARAVGADVVTDPGRATHACLTPTGLERRHGDLPPGCAVVVAGGPLAPALHARTSAAGLRVTSYYGAAELSFVAAGPHAGDLRAFPGVAIEIRGRAIWVRSPYLAAGLGPWATVGDEGRLDGDRLEVFGRPGTVTTAGATVALAEIEAALRACATADVAVVGLPHPALGEIVAAAVTPADDVGALRRSARERLRPEQRPRHWVTLAALPHTDRGKVDHAAVRALLLAEPAR